MHYRNCMQYIIRTFPFGEQCNTNRSTKVTKQYSHHFIFDFPIPGGAELKRGQKRMKEQIKTRKRMQSKISKLRVEGSSDREKQLYNSSSRYKEKNSRSNKGQGKTKLLIIQILMRLRCYFITCMLAKCCRCSTRVAAKHSA